MMQIFGVKFTFEEFLEMEENDLLKELALEETKEIKDNHWIMDYTVNGDMEEYDAWNTMNEDLKRMEHMEVQYVDASYAFMLEYTNKKLYETCLLHSRLLGIPV